jgi:hypothetical protein
MQQAAQAAVGLALLTEVLALTELLTLVLVAVAVTHTALYQEVTAVLELLLFVY